MALTRPVVAAAPTVIELTALFVLRARGPFFRSRPSRLLAASSPGVSGLSLVIPYSPLGALLGLDGPPIALLASLLGITAMYVTATEVAKRWFDR